MTKATYQEIRKNLDFSISSSWVFIHLSVDSMISIFPLGYFIWSSDQLSVNFPNILLSLCSAVCLAVVYFRAFSAMHEAVHGSLHPDKKWNDRFGILFGVFCFLPFEHWKEIHLLHHQWTGNVEQDPVMKLVRDFDGPPTFVTKIISRLWKSWFPVLAIMQEYVFWFVCTTRFMQEKEKTPARFMSLALPILCWAALFYFSGFKWTCAVFIPSFVIYLVMVEVINFPHHLNLPQGRGDLKLPLWEQYKAARSCIYSKWLARNVFLNFNYHTEHHLYPTLPWRELDNLSETLRTNLKGYNFCLGNDWIIRNRKRPIEDVLRPAKVETQTADQTAGSF